MTWQKPYKGLQTVVPDGHGGLQVNTYNGDSWYIESTRQFNKAVAEIKQRQLERLKQETKP